MLFANQPNARAWLSTSDGLGGASCPQRKEPRQVASPAARRLLGGQAITRLRRPYLSLAKGLISAGRRLRLLLHLRAERSQQLAGTAQPCDNAGPNRYRTSPS